jgi:hypothetical protein
MKPQTSQAFTKMRNKFKKFLKDDPYQRGFQEKMDEFAAVSFFPSLILFCPFYSFTHVIDWEIF